MKSIYAVIFTLSLMALFAQAGGKSPDKLPAALEVARKTIAEMLGV
jgi:hypothetical protein